MWQRQGFWPGELWAKPDSQKYGQCIDRSKDAASELITSVKKVSVLFECALRRNKLGRGYVTCFSGSLLL